MLRSSASNISPSNSSSADVQFEMVSHIGPCCIPFLHRHGIAHRTSRSNVQSVNLAKEFACYSTLLEVTISKQPRFTNSPSESVTRRAGPFLGVSVPRMIPSALPFGGPGGIFQRSPEVCQAPDYLLSVLLETQAELSLQVATGISFHIFPVEERSWANTRLKLEGGAG
jgi:hypothetical protein